MKNNIQRFIFLPGVFGVLHGHEDAQPVTCQQDKGQHKDRKSPAGKTVRRSVYTPVGGHKLRQVIPQSQPHKHGQQHNK